MEAKESVAIANNATHILDYISREVASRLLLSVGETVPRYSEGPGAHNLCEKVLGAGLVTLVKRSYQAV